jgi:radical SAM superfamily enzyme YgiQ (UPF0313 family)
MKVLFLAMPDIVPHFFPKSFNFPHLAGPLLAANNPQHKIWVADLILRRKKLKETLKELLEKYKPELIALSAMSFQFFTACQIAQFVRKIDPHIKLTLGGYHPTLMKEEIISSSNRELFDFIIFGEGESSFGELLEAIENKKDFENIKGLCFKRNGKWYINPPRDLEDLSKIKPPLRSARIFTKFRYYGFNLDVVETSRGCTLSCNFCSMNKMYGRSFRTYPLQRTLSDIESAIKNQANFILFADDNITLNLKYFKKLCQAIIENKLNNIIYLIQAGTRGIASSPEIAELMSKAGIKLVFLGIENMSEHNLRKLKKSQTIQEIERAITYLKKAKILVIGGMMLGLPDDTKEDLQRNFQYFYHQQIYAADQFITPYPKTLLREELLKQGYITYKHDFRRYNGFWANIKTKHLSSWQLEYERWHLYRKYYSFGRPPPMLREFSKLIYFLQQYLIGPYRKIIFYLTPQKKAFKRYIKKYSKLNHFFDPYPDIITKEEP